MADRRPLIDGLKPSPPAIDPEVEKQCPFGWPSGSTGFRRGSRNS